MIKLSDLQPTVWYVTNNISIYKVLGGYVAEKSSLFGENHVIKEYDSEHRYWRPELYESKYDLVEFASLEEVVEAINKLEYSI